MTGYDSYSITPATNATCDGGAVNWAEGQPPSTVNNSSRQVLADTRTAFNDLVWFQYGIGDQGAGNIAVPAIYASSTSFTIAGADVTAAYHVGRRLRAVGSGTGTIYGRISVTSYAPTTTTVTAVWDSGSLSNETLVISLSQIPVTGNPVGDLVGTWVPADSSGAGLAFTGVQGFYLKRGRLVSGTATLVYPVTADGSPAQIGGLPFTSSANGTGASAQCYVSSNGTLPYMLINVSNTTINLRTLAGANYQNSAFSTGQINFSFLYQSAI